jgi:dihydropteroate synthase
MNLKTILKKTKPTQLRVGETLYSASPVPSIMGIVNVTPDSFFDGGKYNSTEAAFEHAIKLVEEGAAIIDVGGESSRPGSSSVSEEEELERVLPIIEKLAPFKKDLHFSISIDTVKSKVAYKAMEAGADIINDISALSMDSAMAQVILETKASCILNHMRGNFGTMQQDFKPYSNVVQEVQNELRISAKKLIDLGVPQDKICLDPGIGFGKSLQDNLELIASASDFSEMEFPILWGLSRKSYIGKIPALETSDRLIPSVVSAFITALGGATIVRVHDVASTFESFKLLEAFRSYDSI